MLPRQLPHRLAELHPLDPLKLTDLPHHLLVQHLRVLPRLLHLPLQPHRLQLQLPDPLPPALLMVHTSHVFDLGADEAPGAREAGVVRGGGEGVPVVGGFGEVFG